MRAFTLCWKSFFLLLIVATWSQSSDAIAQCATCQAPPVAYQSVTAYRPVALQPAVAQPVVAYKPYTGWYWGKWFDQQRIRREARAAYRVGYAPYAAVSTPTYTAAYAPAVYTAAYQPYVTAYAPLARSAPAPYTASAQTAYYPIVQTVARQVVMQPVVAATACDTCSFTPNCGCSACSTSCSACSVGVGQAVYNEPACSNCTVGRGTVALPSGSSSPNFGRQTPRPNLSPVPTPADSQYRSNRPVEGNHNHETDRTVDDVDQGVDQDDVDLLDKNDPGPASEIDTSTYHNAPHLLDPRDRTAQSRKPTVAVWTAVYRGPASNRRISPTSAHSRSPTATDAHGWTAVPRDR